MIRFITWGLSLQRHRHYYVWNLFLMSSCVMWYCVFIVNVEAKYFYSRRIDVRGADGSVAGGWAGGRQSGFHSPPGLGPGTLWHCAMCPPIVWKNIQGESKKSVLSNQLEKPTGPYLTLSDLTGPYWALLGLTGPYWALLAYLLNLYTH